MVACESVEEILLKRSKHTEVTLAQTLFAENDQDDNDDDDDKIN